MKRVAVGLVLGGIVILSLCFFDAFVFKILYGFAVVMAVTEIFYAEIYDNKLLRGRKPHKCSTGKFFLTFTLEYLVLLWSFGVVIISGAFDAWSIFAVLLSACLNDVGAYFVGREFGTLFIEKRPFPVISPKKSWEGVIGGAVISIAAVFILMLFRGFSIKLLVLALFGWLVADIGDIVASYLKRLLGLKDSGEQLQKTPGLQILEAPLQTHGGYLDRIDSIAAVLTFTSFLIVLT